MPRRLIWLVGFFLKTSYFFLRICTVKENFAAFGENFSAGVSFQRNTWRKTCQEKYFSFQTSWKISKFFIPFWKKRSSSFDNFAFYVFNELFWGRKSFWKKNNFFIRFGRWGETFAAFWQNVSHRLLELRFKRPEKHFQRENQKNEAIVLILWILSEIYQPTLKIRQSCQVFILLARMKNFKRNFFQSNV